jgi:hypothetical protein
MYKTPSAVRLFSKSMPIFMASLLLLLSGCAHKNYMEEGQKFAQTNQYEAAVEQFSLALNEEPDDVATKNQLNIAKKQLNNWAVALEPKADDAFSDNHLGKALLLYGKSAQITQNPYAVKRYKEIYATLRSQSMINANVLTNKLGISNVTLASIDGIKGSKVGSTSLSFAQSNPIFEIQQSTQDAVTQYISGSQLIANPQLIDLQHQLQDVKRQRHEYNQDINHLSNESHNERSNVQNLSGQLQRIEMSLSATNLSSAQLANYNQRAATLRSQLSSAKSNEKSVVRHLNNAQHSFNSLSKKLHHIADDLSLTPAVVEVPVYSDYVHQEFKQTNTLSGVVYLNVNEVTRTASVNVGSSDTSHPAHPTINLAANALRVLSQQQLKPQYDTERFNIGLRLVNELIAEYKASYLYQAQDSTDLEHKMTLLVQHGLITHDGASKNASTILNDMLIVEFGRGGIFNINQLLHLY